MNPETATPPGNSSPSPLHVRKRPPLALVSVALGFLLTIGLELTAASAPRFEPGNRAGEFVFDTGVLTGTLRPEGKSLGLANVIHRPSGARLDRSNGLLSHYRVFTRGVRYGGGAWDIPSEGRRASDGSVEVVWKAGTNRPFELGATYRWATPDSLDCVTRVTAVTDLMGFEVFLASYFDPAFTNASVNISSLEASSSGPAFLSAEPRLGDWLVFPRDDTAATLIRDGRWKLEPNPVDWVLVQRFHRPLAVRRHPVTGLTAALFAPVNDCFAVAMPHQLEGHYSVYLSLFGKDVRAGTTAQARARLLIAPGITEAALVERHAQYMGESLNRK